MNNRITKENLLKGNNECIKQAHTDHDGWYDVHTYNWMYALALDVVLGKITILNSNWFKGNKI